MSSKRKYFSGASVSQAVLKAARQFGLDPDDVAWEDVEKKTGFVRGRRKVVIAVDPANPKRLAVEPEAPKPARPEVPEKPEPPRAELDDAPSEAVDDRIDDEAETQAPELEEQAPEEKPSDAPAKVRAPKREKKRREVEPEPEREDEPELGDLDEAPPLEPVDAEREDAVWDCLEPLLRLADLEIEAEIGERNGELTVELLGPDSVRVIDRHGEVLDALGQLLPRLLSSEFGERVSCRIDCEGFWYKREMELCRMAFGEARKAIREDRSRSLPPMNPRERRIVHQAIADFEGVTTESRGDGRRKRVVIRPI